MKFEELKSLPNELVTTKGPLVVPAGTTAVTEVELIPVTEVRALLPIFTEVTPSSPTPVIVTIVPAPPEDGVKLVIDGTAVAVELHEGVELTAISEGRAETGAAAAGTK